MRLPPRLPVLTVVVAALLVAAACSSSAPPAADPPPAEPLPEEPRGAPLTGDGIGELIAQFGDEPLIGGQVSPRYSRWVNDQVAIFVEFDRPDADEATELRFLGLNVKGTYCAETQPDAATGSFPHFHRLETDDYGHGHGPDVVPAGTEGYWQTWLAVGDFVNVDDRELTPGVDYLHSPTPAPTCNDDAPEPAFTGPGEGALTGAEIAELAALFSDQPLTGGQTAPRRYLWVNDDVAIFLQFDAADPTEATALRYVGISVRGEFCRSSQPSPDFPYFHRTHGAEYAGSGGQEPGERGHWLAFLAAGSFAAPAGGEITPGIDRNVATTDAPDC